MQRLILSCLVVCAACSKTTTQKEDTNRYMVARIGADTVFLDDFRNYIEIQKGRTIDVSKKSHRDLMLDELVEKRLIQRFGYDQGYARQDDIRSRVRDRESEMLYNKIMRQLVINPAIGREDLDATYEKIRYEKQVSQIFIGHSQVTRRMSIEQVMKTSRSRDEAKRIADSVYHAASQKPATFGELAATYSNDESGQYRGGDIGFLRLDQVDPQFQAAISELTKNEIGAPVETASGFHVFYITDQRQSEDFRSLDAHYDYIFDVTANTLVRQPTEKVRQRFRTVEDSLFHECHFRLNEEAIRIFLDRYGRVKEPVELAGVFDSLQLNLELATFDSGEVKVKEIVREMSDNASLINLGDKLMKEGLRRVARTRIFGDAARKMGLELSQVDSEKLSAFEAEEVVAYTTFRNIFDPVRFDELKLHDYYEANRSRFEALDQVRIQEISSSDKNKIGSYADEIRRLNNFDDVFARAKSDSGVRCESWPLMQDDKKKELISFANRNLKVGQFSDILATQEGTYSIVRLLEKVEGALLPFEQVRPLVVQDYVSGERSRVQNEWITKLYSSYDIEVRKDRLDDFYDLRLK